LLIGPDGDIYVAGETDSYGAGNYDVLLLKYDSAGKALWRRTWGGCSWDRGKRIALDAVGNCYLAGWTYSYGAGGQDLLIAKYDPGGLLLWSKTWGGGDFDKSPAICCDQSGNSYVAVHCGSFGGGWAKIALLKYTSTGSLVSSKYWGGSNDNGLGRLLLKDDGTILGCGSMNSVSGASGYCSLVLSYDTNGSVMWNRLLDGYHNNVFTGLEVDASGNAYIRGYSQGMGAGGKDITAVKLDSLGNTVWQKAWGGLLDELAFGLALSEGFVYVTGYTESYGHGNMDLLLLKLTTDGGILWAKSWGTDGSEGAQDIVSARDGKLIITGHGINAYGDWMSIPTSFLTASFSEKEATGTIGVPGGAETSPSGIVSSPQGVDDAGGGGEDVLIMKIDPSTL